ncbi:DUF5711 family protein [Anaerotignum sp.]|uniref:DUF5711 family protein n=1 Tax=Anaerotignum sp. TaxID=2039241 RepID=UPI0027147173|nr:DUF5711 family protein [Anaerotignum sp.]
MGKSQKERKGKDKGLIMLLIVLTLVGGAAGYVYIDTFHGTGKLQGYFSNVFQKNSSEEEPESTMKTSKKMSIDESSRTTFQIFGKSFLLCTKDGVKYFNEMGDRKWNDTFNMTIPQMVSEGNYVAVGDMSGKTIRVYGENGMLYSVQTEGELMQFALNSNGYLSVISKGDNAYSIQIYNAGGTLLKGRVEESDGVFPLSSDVSDDNKAFVVSYLDTSDVEPIGRVLFFYINPDDSENYTDSMFAAVEKSGEIIPVVGYMQSGVVAAVSDSFVYGISSAGQETWNYPLENRVLQVSLSNKSYVVLALGDAIANKDGREKGAICWIDSSGKESASYQGDGDVDYLQVSEQGVVIGVDKLYFGLRHNGKLDWSYRATSNVRDILPMERLEQVMLVTKNEAMITEMKGDRTARTIVSEETETEHEVVGGMAETGDTTTDNEAPSEAERQISDLDEPQTQTNEAE